MVTGEVDGANSMGVAIFVLISLWLQWLEVIGSSHWRYMYGSAFALDPNRDFATCC